MLYGPEESIIFKAMKNDQAVEAVYRFIKEHPEGADQLLVVSNSRDSHSVLALCADAPVTAKPFFLPLVYPLNQHTYYVFDARAMTRWDRHEHRTVISNPGLYRREVIRTVLQATWQQEGPNALLRLGTFQVKLFTSWVTEQISRRFGLDGEQQMTLSVVVAYYYLSLFTHHKDIDRDRTAIIISRALNLSLAYVQTHLTRIDVVRNAPELLEQLPEVLMSTRIAGLSLDVLIAMLSGTWFGANNTYLIASAIEYPPTFITLAYLALTDKSTKISGLAKLAQRYEREQSCKEFITLTSRLLESEVVGEISPPR